MRARFRYLGGETDTQNDLFKPDPAAATPHARVRAIFWIPLVLVSTYWLVSYLAVPDLWRAYEVRHPALESAQRRAFTSQGIPGDPINIGFVGSEADLVANMIGAGWLPADPITWGSSARIAVDAMVHRAYPNAPVSDLFVWKKKQDMAFEQPFGPDPRKRHHVRFWRSELLDDEGHPLWLGAATFDTRVGVSHLTGQVTHHIDADVDRERDKLGEDLGKNPALGFDWIDDFQPVRTGKNGGGDVFYTDGRLRLVRRTGS